MASDGSLRSNLEPEQCGQGGYTRLGPDVVERIVRRFNDGDMSVEDATVSLGIMTPWTVAYQAPPSVGFSRQEYWSRLPFPPPRALSDPGIKPACPASQVGSLPQCHWEAPK